MNRPPMRGRPWTATERTGGPLDLVLDQLRQQHPGLIVERLEVAHHGDDDNVYFIGDQHGVDRVQVDTVPHGQPPFLIEAAQQHQTSDPTQAIAVIASCLRTSG